jgi:hypothetical protein
MGRVALGVAGGPHRTNRSTGLRKLSLCFCNKIGKMEIGRARFCVRCVCQFRHPGDWKAYPLNGSS